MFFKDDKKRQGVVSLIVKKMKGGDTYENMVEHNSSANGSAEKTDYEVGYESASNDMISAIESKDVKAFKSALYSFIEMAVCELEESESESEQED